MTNEKSQVVDLARRFHDAYERLAPQFGYTTREDTRVFNPELPNGKLMIAVCAALTSQQEVAAPVLSMLVNELVEQGQFFKRGDIDEATFISAVNHYVSHFAASRVPVAKPVGYVCSQRLRDLQEGRTLSISLVHESEAVLEDVPGFAPDIPVYTAPPSSKAQDS